MAFTSERIPLYSPALGAVYEALKPYTYTFLRVMIGLFYVPHGMQKLFGLFGAATTEQFVAGFGRMGPFWGQAGWVYYIGSLEFFGGLLMAAGLFTRLVAIQFIGFMGMAVFVANVPNGWFWTKGGIEAPLILGVVCLVVLINGGGRFSIDHAIGKEI
jgi:putative oxidoreductase